MVVTRVALCKAVPCERSGTPGHPEEKRSKLRQYHDKPLAPGHPVLPILRIIGTGTGFVEICIVGDTCSAKLVGRPSARTLATHGHQAGCRRSSVLSRVKVLSMCSDLRTECASCAQSTAEGDDVHALMVQLMIQTSRTRKTPRSESQKLDSRASTSRHIQIPTFTQKKRTSGGSFVGISLGMGLSSSNCKWYV